MAQTFLLLLLLIDGVMMVLHLLLWYTNLLDNELYSISRDRGYAEFFQYIKLFWLAALFMRHAIKARAPAYLFWAGVFALLFLDDFLALHERIGMMARQRLELPGLLGVRGDDLAELAFYVAVGVVLALVVVPVYRYSSGAFRRDSLIVVGLLAIFACFAIGVDMVHMHESVRETVYFRLIDVIEDGGEMIVISFALYFALLMVQRRELSSALDRPNTMT